MIKYYLLNVHILLSNIINYLENYKKDVSFQ